MKASVGVCLVTLAIVSSPLSAVALEPLAVYDKWDDPDLLIRSDRWRGNEDSGGTEVLRQIVAGAKNKLSMRYRLEGFIVPNTPPTGQVVARNYLRFTNPTSVTAVQGTFVVNPLTVVPCAANNAAAATQAAPTHMALARFNDGSSTGPSDRTGDIEGVIGTFRNGSSADPAGVLQVFGSIVRSTSASGNFSSILGSVSLGTVNVGTPFTLQMVWDKPNKQFLYSLNAGTPQAVAYTATDSAEAVMPFAQIFQRFAIANCHDAVPAIDATTIIKKVWTNASAVIP
jgi:hypothetical protein